MAKMVLEWMKGSEDGGILNYLFEVYEVGPSKHFRLCPQITDLVLLVKRLANMVFSRGQSLEVLATLPRELGGGTEGIEKAKENPPGYTKFISLFFVLSLIVVSSSVVMLYFSLRKSLTAGHSGRYHVYGCFKCIYRTFSAQNISEVKSSSASCLSHSDVSLNRKSFGRPFLVLLVFGALFSIFLLTTTCHYFYGTSVVVGTLGGQATLGDQLEGREHFTLTGLLQFSVEQVLFFISEGLANAKILTDANLRAVEQTIEKTLRDGISEITQSLLDAYGIKILNTSAIALIADLKVMEGNMDVIRMNNQKTIQDISVLVGSFSTVHMIIKNDLSELCKLDMGTSLNTLCADLQRKSALLQIVFDAKTIKSDPPAVLNFLLSSFGLDLGNILSMLERTTNELAKNEDRAYTDINNVLKVKDIIRSVSSYLTQAEQSMLGIQSHLHNVSQSLSQKLALLLPSLNLIAYWPAVFFGLFIILHVAILLEVCFALIDCGQLQLPYSKPSSEGTHLAKGAFSRPVGVLVLSVLVTLGILLLAGFAFILLVSASVLTNQACPYLASPTGRAKTDFILDDLLATVWPELVRDFKVTIPQDMSKTNILLLRPPMSILRAVGLLCSSSAVPSVETVNTQPGLLNAIGWDSIIDVRALLSSDYIQKEIRKSKTFVMNSMKNINIGQYLPTSISTISNLVKNLTNYFDSIDYKLSIDQLRPSLIPVNDLKEFYVKLDELGIASKNLGLSHGQNLVSSAETLKQSLAKSAEVQREVNSLRVAFEKVQNKQNLTFSLDSLLKQLEAVIAVLSDEKTRLAPVSAVFEIFINGFLSRLTTRTSVIFEKLTYLLLPCRRLYNIAHAILSEGCQNEGIFVRIFALGLILSFAALSAFFTYASIYLLCLQMPDTILHQ